MENKTHPDVEFAVTHLDGRERTYKTWDEACGQAVAIAASGRTDVSIDVLIYSVEGAAWYGGDHAVEEYRADPDASVSDRVMLKGAESIGRVA
jgi:hypothetical protein